MLRSKHRSGSSFASSIKQKLKKMKTIKISLFMLLSAVAFGQTPIASYSFTQSGAAITECDCKTQMPKEFWAHLNIPDAAYTFDKVSFIIYPQASQDTNLSSGDKKETSVSGGFGTWTYTREQLEQKFPKTTGQKINFQLLNPENAKLEYKGSCDMNQRTLCYYSLVDQYSIRIAIVGYTKIGTRQVWETKYTDGTGGGWWETVTDYDNGIYIVKESEAILIKQDTERRDKNAKQYKKKNRRFLIIAAAVLVPIVVLTKMKDAKGTE